MNEKDKQILEEANKVVEDTKRSVLRNQDREYIVREVSAVLLNELTPVLQSINKATKDAVSQYLEGISKIQLKPPSVIVKPTDVNLPAPKVNVETPKAEIKVNLHKIPEINTDKIEKAITKSMEMVIKKIKIPTPKVEVKEKSFKMPSEIKVNGIAGYFGNLLKALAGVLSVRLVNVDYDNPLPTLLVDTKGRPYKASSLGISTGGGRGVVETKPIEEFPCGYEQLVVSNTAIPFADIPENANKAVVSVEDATIRYRENGADPTATVGIIAPRFTVIILNSRASITNFRAIRTAATDAELNILYYERK